MTLKSKNKFWENEREKYKLRMFLTLMLLLAFAFAFIPMNVAACGCTSNNSNNTGDSGTSETYSGGGYIQLTGAKNYKAYADYIVGKQIYSKGRTYATDKYAWDHGKVNKYAKSQSATVEGVTNRFQGSGVPKVR